MNDTDPRVLADAVLAATDQALTASYRTIFDALGEAFCVVEVIFDDRGAAVDYRYLEVNRAFEDHTGLDDALGRTAREVVPRIEPFWIDTLGHVARSREALRFVEEVRTLRRWYTVYAWPLARAGDHRVAVHFVDITERKAARDELLVRSRRFHTLVQQAPIGVFLIDADFRLAEVNPTARTLFGDADVVGRDYEDVLRSLWPEELADEVVQVTRRALVTGVPHYEPEMAAVHADRGIVEHYEWRMDRIHLPDGLDGVVCYFNDISNQVRARLALTASESRYRTLFESIDEGFCILEVIFDDRGAAVDYRYLEVNPAFVRHTGLDDAYGRTITEMVPDIERFWFEAYGDVALTGVPTRFVAHAEPLGRWFDISAFRVGDPVEHKVAVLFSDVTERKRAELALQESVALLRHHAHHDVLTGLPNRLLFEEKLHEAVASADRHGRPFALLFLDLDGFKAINDDLGHAYGDAVLIEVARRLRRSLRVNDMVARIHGDEFVFILPETADPNEAGNVARKLLGIVSAPIDVAGETVRVQASIGVGLYPNDGANPRALLRAADTAMYQAKLRGKNAVHYVVAPRDGRGGSGEPS